MEGSVLIDSNVFIGLLRRGVDPVECLGNWIGAGDLATCGMVRLEVERGIKVEKTRKILSSFFDVMLNAPTSNQIWERATHLAWSLDRHGRTLPAQDILIASCAQSIGAAVLTDDAHFFQIPDILVLSPKDELSGW